MRSDVELTATEDRLCQQCYRKNEDELAALQRGDDTTVEESKATKKSSVKRNGKKTKKGTTESVDNSADDVTSQPTASERNEEVTLLRQTIKSQQNEIKILQNKLAYVLSYLGIDDLELEGALIESSDQVSHNADENDDESDENGDSDATHVNNGDVVRSAGLQVESIKDPHRQTNKFQQSIVAAVYVDQALKQHRQSSLIVSGLAPSSTASDVEQFKSMCDAEFNIQPSVITTKRLGRPQTGKIQPLLVVMQLADHAQQLIANARQLRQSSNETVRTRVYINPNLTRAEAEAAYRVRVQRREATKRRLNQPTQHLQQQQQNADQYGNNGTVRPPAETANVTNNGSANGRRI